MVRLRKFEERCYQVYLQRKIGGFCHIYSGQEAVAVGMISLLGPQDYVITAYRDHGQALARGLSVKACMAELYGKATGCSRGKGGSMHFFDTSVRFMGGHGIVGAHVPLACGIGWAIKHQDQKGVCLCFFGDGAMNQGAVHEALNLASLYKLPVVFVCENNGYAMGTAVARGAAEENIYLRANSYKMPTCRVDGNNLFEVMDVTGGLIRRAREEFQPSFVEAVTYRFRGHSMSDPGSYRTREEVDAHKARDPIAQVAQHILKQKHAASGDLDEIDAEESASVEESVKFAEESPPPSPDALYEDIYA
ncbi:MAG: pyruvate dehydrogenase (acetyl-transferring) E1 component subunit alpha [Candidatus Lindowbacteria bacterium RIFCSPLOWO2_12_FULL_62_27]|nr:MAG: pyruvate dehydrogenase (acetyl-transferring) E1 component subunit alpha [Candidatus Lindowbacteria bacterium RIFCSPLOWO2_02_FULL_62_12]OGH60847.1 MAG: pyruvate dehydrogenase (acetyl-transferring) E1 component subunit alpha [Candidatus Lindowbacteria bacterium RIFCSPLOWO2_12_FULL_62_27]